MIISAKKPSKRLSKMFFISNCVRSSLRASCKFCKRWKISPVISFFAPKKSLKRFSNMTLYSSFLRALCKSEISSLMLQYHCVRTSARITHTLPNINFALDILPINWIPSVYIPKFGYVENVFHEIEMKILDLTRILAYKNWPHQVASQLSKKYAEIHTTYRKLDARHK